MPRPFIDQSRNEHMQPEYSINALSKRQLQILKTALEPLEETLKNRLDRIFGYMHTHPHDEEKRREQSETMQMVNEINALMAPLAEHA